MSLYTKKRLSLSRIMLPSVFVMLAQSVPAAYAQAQDGIAEDFSSDPFSLRIQLDNLGSTLDGVSLGADGTSIRLRASSTNDERGKIVLQPIKNDNNNEISVNAMFSSDTQFDAANPTKASMTLASYFYNDFQEGGLGDDERTGDSQVRISMIYQDESIGDNFVWICFERRNTDGSKSVQPGADVYNGESCTGIATVPQYDTLHTMTIGYDKAAATVYADFDGDRISHAITTGHFTPQNPNSEVDFRADASGTVAIGSIHSVRTNAFDSSDLSAYAGESPYRSPNSDEDIAVVGGKLRLGVESDGSTENETNRAFRALGETEYVEAKIMLSADSTLNGSGFNIARLRNSFYNEVQDGGTGDDGLGASAGDVFSTLNLFRDEGGAVKADLAIIRGDNGNFSASTVLSNDPDVQFPVLKEGLALDTEYTASIRLDKEAKQLIFKFDDAEYTYDILSDIHRASFVNGAGVDARIVGAGESVVFADDFRTSPTAKTNEELAAEGGQTTGGDTGSTDAGSTDTGGTGGGGGCTVGASGSSTGFMFLMALLVSFLGVRRRITTVKN